MQTGMNKKKSLWPCCQTADNSNDTEGVYNRESTTKRPALVLPGAYCEMERIRRDKESNGRPGFKESEWESFKLGRNQTPREPSYGSIPGMIEEEEKIDVQELKRLPTETRKRPQNKSSDEILDKSQTAATNNQYFYSQIGNNLINSREIEYTSEIIGSENSSFMIPVEIREEPSNSEMDGVYYSRSSSSLGNQIAPHSSERSNGIHKQARNKADLHRRTEKPCKLKLKPVTLREEDEDIC